MTNSQSAHPTQVNDMEQTQGVPAGASSAESPCQFAIDGGGNLYRRYSEPVCASCVPVMKLTDKWESARVADFNAGWNACRNAMLSAAPQAQPVTPATHDTICKLLKDAMDVAVANGANSVSMPDEYVELALWLSQVPTTAQAQPVEAEQAGAEAHGLDDLRRDLIADTCEVFDASGSETFQVVRDVIEYVDSWLQVQVGRAADRAKAQPKVVGKPAQPVREPMSEAEAKVIWSEARGCNHGYVPLMRAVERYCAEKWGVKLAGIGSKGGAESDVSGQGSSA
jgi:hypothetical protein